MRAWGIFCGFLLTACGGEPKEVTVTSNRTQSSTPPATYETSSDTDVNFAKDTQDYSTRQIESTKSPSGVYRFLLSSDEGEKILHTIAFYPGRYRLQEEYPGKKDSTVVTVGTWAPSQGYIWLYKDQIQRGRYTWKEDTLQYYNPQSKKAFSLTKLSPAMANAVWQTKKTSGSRLYSVGTEPFWSVEINKNDSIVMNMPDWNAPLRVKVAAANVQKDSIVYTAATDSLRVIVYPLFCNDGMSDFLYTQKVKVVYKGQAYAGCGEILRTSN